MNKDEVMALVFMMIWIITDAFAYDKDAREKRRANERQYQACIAKCSMTCPGVKR